MHNSAHDMNKGRKTLPCHCTAAFLSIQHNVSPTPLCFGSPIIWDIKKGIEELHEVVALWSSGTTSIGLG